MVKFHRCRFVKFKIGACWTVQEALDEQGIAYENVIEPTYPRGKRKDIIEHTGQHYLPAIEFEDGTWYREESNPRRFAPGGLPRRQVLRYPNRVYSSSR